MATIRWGVLSTAAIGVRKVIPGMLKSPQGQITAIASRDAARAEAVARQFGFPKHYGSYEELLADPEIDAVYNPLPNHLHVPLSIKALEAGKHVLCEKPIALDAKEAETLIAARDASGKQVLEAFMVRQHPQWIRTREIVRSGEIGAVGLVSVTLSYFNADPANIRNMAGIGGGGLYDIGCYAVVLARYLFGAEPLRAVSLIDFDPVMKTDRLASGIVDFGGGRRLVFTSSTQLSPYQTTQVIGTKGRIEVPVSLNAPQGEATRILVDLKGPLDPEPPRTEEIAPCDQYTLQAEAAARIFLGEEEAEFPIEDAVRNMRVIDALYRSTETGAWQTV
ncbi:Gfo/Idh/MocA family protein [Prosthecomicrobium pneumaticum]|uniref:Putative dehydrogenase n=1 Tax=Prosthecomicrobium pneumaticum TaxID=81895 RepID=A0A7W9CUL9_9HYPH|nr:Gfo/Idh/MocA family oxidoreductase [Prosthecomicrobium pneumaticum]MBB5751821.1 putative dehydrogenase [Prosthecomicrobium pneumaticum]